MRVALRGVRTLLAKINTIRIESERRFIYEKSNA